MAQPRHKLNLPKAPKEHNEDREWAIIIGTSVLAVGAVSFLAPKEAAPMSVAATGLVVGACVTINARRKRKNESHLDH